MPRTPQGHHQTLSSYSSRVSMVSQRRSCFKSTSSLNDCKKGRERRAHSSLLPSTLVQTCRVTPCRRGVSPTE